jgi:hypothetical protein
MLPDDAVNGRQPEARSFADVLRRKERLEDARQIFRRDSAAGVADRQPDVRTGRGVGIQLCLPFIQRFRAGGDGETPASRHGVTRIDREVQDHLFDHAGVAEHRRQRGCEIGAEGDVLAQNALEHPGHASHHLVQIQVHWLHDLFAAEEQQLADQPGGAFRGADDLVRTIGFLGGF